MSIPPRTQPNILDGLKRLINEYQIEVAVPPRLRRKGLVASESQRLGGLTNRNYKVEVGGEALVLRLPGRGTGRFINRSVERANQEIASKAGYSPQSIYFNGRTGVKITPYLAEARTLDPAAAREEATIASVAVLLRSFHCAPIRFVNDFDVFALARTYERVARSRAARFFDGYVDIRDRIFSLELPLAGIAGERVACHNDLVPENILETDERLTMIDWEYSGMNDPAWDVASFSLESGFAEAEDELFLRAYCGSAPSRRFVDAVDAYKLLQDFLWSTWSILQETANRRPEMARRYREYGRERFLRGSARLERVESRFCRGEAAQ